MLAFTRTAGISRVGSRSFASSARRADLAKLTLIGRLGKDPLVKIATNDREYVVYTVATRNPSRPPSADGTRPDPTTSWHTVLSFSPTANDYLKTLKKGYQVYVEAAYELKEPETSADPESAAAQRQIYLRHDTLKVLSRPVTHEESESG